MTLSLKGQINKAGMEQKAAPNKALQRTPTSCAAELQRSASLWIP